MNGISLRRRIAHLEDRLAPRRPDLELLLRPEDIARMQEIVDRVYGDPERYATRIARMNEIIDRHGGWR